MGAEPEMIQENRKNKKMLQASGRGKHTGRHRHRHGLSSTFRYKASTCSISSMGSPLILIKSRPKTRQLAQINCPHPSPYPPLLQPILARKSTRYPPQKEISIKTLPSFLNQAKQESKPFGSFLSFLCDRAQKPAIAQ